MIKLFCILFILSFYSSVALPHTSRLGGKTIELENGNPFVLTQVGSDEIITVKKGNKFILMKTEDARKRIPNYDPSLAYFTVKGHGKSSFYSEPRKEFEQHIRWNKFGGFVKGNYTKDKKQADDLRKKLNAWQKKKGLNTVITSYKKSFKIKNINSGKSSVVIDRNGLEILPEIQIPGFPNHDKDRVYFKVKKKGIGSDEVYFLTSREFENFIKKEQFGAWFKTEFAKGSDEIPKLLKRATKPKKKIVPRVKIEMMRKYTVSKRIKPIALTLHLEGGDMNNVYELWKDDEFHFIVEDGKEYIVKPAPDNSRFTVVHQDQLNELFANGSIKVGEKVKVQDLVFEAAGSIKAPPTKNNMPISTAPDPLQVASSTPQKKESPPQVSTPFPARPHKRTLLGTTKTVKRSIEYIEAKNENANLEYSCVDIKNHINETSAIKSCDSTDNYIQDLLETELTDEEINENSVDKFCIIAGMAGSKGLFKYSICDDKGNLTKDKDQACKSKEYVTFVHEEMDAMADCFNNVSLKEIIPLVNTESRFNFNAYNNNSDNKVGFPGQQSLNASGLLQTTQALIDTQKQPMIIGGYTRKNPEFKKYNDRFNSKLPYCNAIKSELKNNPFKTEYDHYIVGKNRDGSPRVEKRTIPKNVCKRTSVPEGFRKNLFLAMAQYSYMKKEAKVLLDNVEEIFYGGVTNKMFNEKDKDKIITDITRLMHNRGIGRITNRFYSFFYDIFRGKDDLEVYDDSKKGQNITKIYQIGVSRKEVFRTTSSGKKVRVIGKDKHVKMALQPDKKKFVHGNAKIHKGWGTDSFSSPLTHDHFVDNFSSYIFYEGKRSRTSKGKNIEPNSTRADSEGGTYLHKMACDQKRMTDIARKYAGSENLVCGENYISPERLEKTQVEVAWYWNGCTIKNTQQTSIDKCSAKSPYKATLNGKRRFSDELIRTYSKQERWLGKCDRDTLRGLASRPLLKFYSKEPEVYQQGSN